jgi:hypothetical protein
VPTPIGELRSAFGGGVFYVSDASGRFVQRVSTANGTVADVPYDGAGDTNATVVALEAIGTSWVVVWTIPRPNELNYKMQAENGSTLDLGSDPVNAVTVATEPDGPVVYLARGTSVDRITGALGSAPKQNTFLRVSASAFAIDPSYAYSAKGQNGIFVYDRTQPENPISKIQLAPNDIDGMFARYGDQLFAYGYDMDNSFLPSIGRLAGGTYEPIVTAQQDDVPITLAADASHAYWSYQQQQHGMGIARARWTGANLADREVVVPDEVGRLYRQIAVDRGCLYYWTAQEGAESELHVRPVPP